MKIKVKKKGILYFFSALMALINVSFICLVGCNKDYSFDLQENYRFRKWKGSGTGREIRHTPDGVLVTHVLAFDTYDYLIIGYSEIPIKYYPKTEYEKRYFIIDTETHGVAKDLDKVEWLKLLAKYGIAKEPSVKRVSRLWGIGRKDRKLENPQDFHIESNVKVSWFRVGPPPPIDINAADAEKLEKLPRIGSFTAARICYEREKDGPFTSLEEVARRVKGVDAKTIAKWRKKGKVIFGPTPQ